MELFIKYIIKIVVGFNEYICGFSINKVVGVEISLWLIEYIFLLFNIFYYCIFSFLVKYFL